MKKSLPGNHRLGTMVCIGLMASLAACGGSDGDSTAATGPASGAAPAPSVTGGTVLGSYFRNAKVCLDSNANARCDSGEASVRSDSNGKFLLPGSAALVVAEIGTDAMEYDPASKTEKAVAAKMILRAPKEAPGMVSLHSTSVVAEMEVNGLSYADALRKVALAVGVTADKLLADFNLESDASAKAVLKSASDDGLKRLQDSLAGLAPDADAKARIATAALTDRFYQTKAPYRPQQDVSTFEVAPAGYSPVSVQLVARHGSRGLSSFKYDLAVYNLWQQAKTDGALTPLGEKLGPAVLKIMKANFLLGYNVAGISKPGYGNETQVGIDEHKQLAVRMLERVPAYWKQVGDTAASAPRKIVVVTSGVDRAVDSGSFFVQSMTATQPALDRVVSLPAAPGPYPDTGAAQAQPNGVNRFLLYFHKLVKASDLVSKPSDPLLQTYADSQEYQAFKDSDDLKAKQDGLFSTPEAKAAGRSVMERLFTKTFIDKIDNGSYRFANTGTFSFTSDDGKFSPSLSGDGKTKIASLADAGQLLYELYVIAPAMKAEAGVDFTPFMPAAQARVFASLNDASDFYDKGPGMTEKGDVTYKMAQILVDDLFGEVDVVAANPLGNAAKLRFAHAEIMAPFAVRMGLKTVDRQLPKAQTFSYDNNPWRGEYVSPMAANMQWDVYKNSAGKVLVKMLYNEKETDFKAACDGAKISPASKYYDFSKLKACYYKS